MLNKITILFLFFALNTYSQSSDISEINKFLFDKSFFKAMKLKNLEDYEGALKSFKKCIEINPKISIPFYELARIYKKTGDNFLAEKNIKEASRLSSKNKWYLYEYAQILFQNNKYQESTKQYEKLVEIESDISRIPGVFEVDYSKDMISDINNNIRNISFIFSGIFIILFFISVILISNTLRIALFSQRFLIRSMQLVGATSRYILKPFLLRGILYGLISGILSSGFLYFIILFINERINGSNLIVSIEKLSIIFITLIVVGILMVILSTYSSVNRYLGSTLDDLYN